MLTRKDAQQAEKAGHKVPKANTTNSQSRVMSTSYGFVQGYNAQAVANAKQVIVAAQVTDERNDQAQLHPMIAATAASLAAAGITERPEKLLADAGYASEANFAQLDDDDPALPAGTDRRLSRPPQPPGHRAHP